MTGKIKSIIKNLYIGYNKIFKDLKVKIGLIFLYK